MKKMGKYCKAYEVKRLAEFPGWAEKKRKGSAQDNKVNGNSSEEANRDFYYLQENYTATDGIFLDENVMYDNVTPEWIEFCKNTLKFEVPNYD